MPDRISWSRVIVEGAVIVGSILLALGLEAWWSGVQSRRAAHQELGTVLSELQESRDQLEAQVQRHERARVGTDALLSHLESVPVNATVSVPDTVVTLLITIFVSDVPTAVTDAFVASGRLEELRNEDLKRGLLRWPSIVEDLRDDESRARGHLDQEVMPYLRTFEITPAIGLPSRRRAPVEADFTSTTELRNLLKYQSAHLEVALIGVRGALQDLDELTALAEQELS